MYAIGRLKDTLHKQDHILQDRHCYLLIIILTIVRVSLMNVRACLPDHDCNSYIDMLQNWWVAGANPGHHAMRFLPSLLAKGLHFLGLSIEHSFLLLSGGAYVLTGWLSFWVLRKMQVDKVLALSGALLMLSFHEGLKVSLVDPYQACDAFVYPLLLGLFYSTHIKNTKAVWALGLLSIIVRQNLVIFAILCLLKLFFESKSKKALFAMGTIVSLYTASQIYFGATGMFVMLMSPPNGFLDFPYWGWVLLDSQLINLLFPIVPFLFYCWRQSYQFLASNWHVLIYGIIVVGQPLLGYHWTGNNFPRLASQGVFWLAFMVPIVLNQIKTSPNVKVGVWVYSLLTYTTWGILQRVIFLGSFIFYTALIAMYNALA